MADFLDRSAQIQRRDIRTISLMNFENRSGKSVDMEVLFRQLTNSIVDRTDLKLVDRAYMEEYLKEQGLWFDRITEASQRADIGRLYGIDAFVHGTIRSVEDDRIICVVRMNDVETNVDIDAEKLTAVAENMEWYLPDMLRNVGPSEFRSRPLGATVTVDGEIIGETPVTHQLTNGRHEVVFSKPRYANKTIEVVSRYGQGQEVHADLELAYSDVRIVTRPAGADVVLDGESQGKSPVTDLKLAYGKIKVQASRDMYEGATKSFVVDGPTSRVHPHLQPKTKRQGDPVLAALPGGGQHYKGQHGKGWLFTLGVAGSAGFAVMNESARSSAVDDYEAAREDYLDAMTQDEMDRLFAIMEDKWSEADDKKKLRDYGWYAAGGIWALNVIDAALGWPAAEAGVTVGAAPVETGGPGVAVTVWR